MNPDNVLYHLVGDISGRKFIINMTAGDFTQLSEHYKLRGTLAKPMPQKGPTVLRLTRVGIEALADKAYNIKPYQVNETGQIIAWYEPHNLNRRSIIPHSIEEDYVLASLGELGVPTVDEIPTPVESHIDHYCEDSF